MSGVPLQPRTVDVQPWVMPAWMKLYAPHFANTGNNDIEEFMNMASPAPGENEIRWVLMWCIRSQVALLERMHAQGLIQ